MPSGGSFCTVNINHNFNTQLSTPSNCLIPDIEAVFYRSADNTFFGQFWVCPFVDLWRCWVRVAVFPLQQQFCRNRNPQQVKAVVGDLRQHIMHILRPHAIKYLTANIIAEPVAARQPDRIPVSVNDFRIVIDVQPVIVPSVWLCGGRYRRSDGRTCSQQQGGNRKEGT